jgi:hypothetical protein
MTRYTYLVADLRSGEIFDELPLTEVTFSRALNDVGELRGQLPLGDPRVPAAEIRAMTEPARSAIYVDREGVLVWGGIIWTTRYTASTKTLEIGAADFLSYLDHRMLIDLDGEDGPVAHLPPITFTDTPQLEIVRGLVDYAQRTPPGNIGLEVVTPPVSSAPRTVVYAPAELKKVTDAIRDLADLDGGPDFTCEVTYGPDGLPRRMVRVGDPYLGRQGTPHVWEYGVNIVDYAWPRDGAGLATRIFTVGAGSAEEQVMAFAEDTGAYERGWPILEDSASYTDVTDEAMLQSYAYAEQASRSGPVVLAELTVRADIEPELGTYDVGDDARFVIEDTYFPEGIDVYLRIVGFEVTPGADAGEEQVKLTVSATLAGAA